MNYLDDPLYPKDCIDYLAQTGNFTLISEGFVCTSPSCDNCPGCERNIFCIYKRDVEKRKSIVTIITTNHPEYFI